jgi:hypothetical protein
MKVQKLLINWLYWLFIIGFIIQITAIGWYFYLTLTTPNSESAVMIHSDVRVFSDSSYISTLPTIQKDSAIGVRIGYRPIGSSAVLYHNYKQLTSRAFIVLFLNCAQYLIWLMFTWQLLQVFKSLKQQRIFEKRNILRLRIVAFVVGIAPILMLIRNIIYPNLLAENAVVPHHRVVYYYDASMFEGLFYMVLILLIVEIFKYGISLKEEQDLTI